MRFADAGRAVNEKRIIGPGALFRHGERRRVREAVAGADDEVFKRELRIELHKARLFLAGTVGLNLRFVKDNQFQVHVEELFERVLNVDRAAGNDHVLAEGGRREENELLVRQLEHFRVVKPRGNDGGRELLFHMAKDLGPDIGRGVQV